MGPSGEESASLETIPWAGIVGLCASPLLLRVSHKVRTSSDTSYGCDVLPQPGSKATDQMDL